MNATVILSDLKNRKFKPVYLLHGEEPYYIDLISEYIENHILSDAEKGFNQTVLYGRDTDMLSIIHAAKRFPMMSDYQVILVKEAQDLKWGKDDDDKKAADPALSYFENPLQSTILVFCYKHAKFDKRKKTYKAIEKKGLVFESAKIYDDKAAGWIETYVKEHGAKIHSAAAALMAEYLGTDLSKIANELDKLLLNKQKGQEITQSDVQDNIGISKDFNVFELQTALSKKNTAKAFQIVEYFGANPKSNPIQMVLGALNSYFTKVLKYHYCKNSPNLAKDLGVNPYFIKDYTLAAANYPPSKVFDVISYLREYDLKSKGVDTGGNIENGELLKELVFKILS